ncbi:MAG TPA: hypothetical protein VE569_04735 [Acidimicrobiia bacterium]|nr:hypothetical protein [Acidimicrobiia bacterium]
MRLHQLPGLFDRLQDDLPAIVVVEVGEADHRHFFRLEDRPGVDLTLDAKTQLES